MFKLSAQELAYRYDISNFIRRTESTSYFDIVDSTFLNDLKSLKGMETYTVKFEANRPDLLSEAIYGSGITQLWWIVMTVNGLRLPTEIKTNMTVQYPTLDQLESLYFKLSARKSTLLVDIRGANIELLD